MTPTMIRTITTITITPTMPTPPLRECISILPLQVPALGYAPGVNRRRTAAGPDRAVPPRAIHSLDPDAPMDCVDWVRRSNKRIAIGARTQQLGTEARAQRPSPSGEPAIGDSARSLQPAMGAVTAVWNCSEVIISNAE